MVVKQTVSLFHPRVILSRYFLLGPGSAATQNGSALPFAVETGAYLVEERRGPTNPCTGAKNQGTTP